MSQPNVSDPTPAALRAWAVAEAEKCEAERALEQSALDALLDQPANARGRASRSATITALAHRSAQFRTVAGMAEKAERHDDAAFLAELLTEGDGVRGGRPWQLRDLLVKAMQDAWDDFVTDTGCYPDCIEKHPRGRIAANFDSSNFALFVAEAFRARLADLRSAPRGRAGGERGR